MEFYRKLMECFWENVEYLGNSWNSVGKTELWEKKPWNSVKKKLDFFLF